MENITIKRCYQTGTEGVTHFCVFKLKYVSFEAKRNHNAFIIVHSFNCSTTSYGAKLNVKNLGKHACSF